MNNNPLSLELTTATKTEARANFVPPSTTTTTETNIKRWNKMNSKEWLTFWRKEYTTVDDILLIEENQERVPLTKSTMNTDTSHVVSLCRIPIQGIPVLGMQKFCVVAKVRNYSRKNKRALCELLYAHKKNIGKVVSQVGELRRDPPYADEAELADSIVLAAPRRERNNFAKKISVIRYLPKPCHNPYMTQVNGKTEGFKHFEDAYNKMVSNGYVPLNVEIISHYKKVIEDAESNDEYNKVAMIFYEPNDK